jgi:hypothetical protein
MPAATETLPGRGTVVTVPEQGVRQDATLVHIIM